jgi:hypothetical protein
MTLIREDIDALREEVDALRGEIAGMRSQLTHIAIALAGTYPAMTCRNRSSQTGGSIPSIGIYSWGAPK